MNLGSGHNAFSDIPGFDATKGERIVKALQRLWAKIELLEQIRISERKTRSKEVQTSANEEDPSITDVQYKLLVLQLQYARSIIRKKLSEIGDANNECASKSQSSYERNGNGKSDIDSEHSIKESVLQAVCQETQTGNSLIEGVDPQFNADFERNPTTGHSQDSTDAPVFEPEDDIHPSASSNYRTKFANSKPHYHLKLDDVPFILGASSTASHSVVANVQNIIAMMKTHNKALCGTRHNPPRATSSKSYASVGKSQDTSHMLNKLSQDLHELAQKQENLVKKLDFVQKQSHLSVTSEFSDNINRNREKKVSNEGHKRVCSNSESIKVQAEVKNASKVRERDIAKYNAQQQRLIMPMTRNQSTSNLSIMARRKLLRSLQNFKSHLSEEDISWE